MLLITSIPPKTHRPVLGRNIGPEWQTTCLTSWIESGFKVISVNAPDECSEVSSKFPQVQVVSASRSAEKVCGRPLIFISDLLEVGALSKEAVFCITNADIKFNFHANSLAFFEASVFSYAFSNRIDIQCPPTSRDLKIHGGADFFVLKASAAQALNSQVLFAMGMPWWDYWLPFSLKSLGYVGGKLSQPNGLPLLTHLWHEDKWDAALFNFGFSQFCNDVFLGGVNIDQPTKLPSPVELNQADIEFKAWLARKISSYMHESTVSILI